MSAAASDRMFVVRQYDSIGDLITDTSSLASSARGLLAQQLESPDSDSMFALYALMQLIEAALEKAEEICLFKPEGA